MNNQKIIGFDMDGVVVDINPLKFKVLKKLGWKLKIANMPVEIITKILTPKVLESMRGALYFKKAIAMRTKLMPGLCDLLDQLRKVKTQYFLISRRAEPEIAKELLLARGLWPKYFNELNAFFVITPEDKNIKAKELGVTHYVDDETKVLAVLADVPNKFLFDDLNVFPSSENYTKVSSHKELERYLFN